MKAKEICAKGFKSMLTIISPMLNTRVLYYVKFHKRLDFNNPVTLNDKILWLKFHDYWNNPIISQCADKYRVREYLESKGFGNLLNHLLGAYDNVDDIPWEDLPARFALKLNVGCGYNLIVSDKSKLDIEKTKKMLKKWMKSKYYLEHSEMQYKNVKPYILIENYLGDEEGNLPEDYKFYCMNGKSKYVMVCTDREIGEHAKYFYFDKSWKMMPYTQDALDDPNRDIPKPQYIDEAFEIAEKLSRDFPFVRTDLYIVGGRVYFGELTFTPSAGMDVSRLKTTDIMLGEQLKLNIALEHLTKPDK